MSTKDWQLDISRTGSTSSSGYFKIREFNLSRFDWKKSHECRLASGKSCGFLALFALTTL